MRPTFYNVPTVVFINNVQLNFGGRVLAPCSLLETFKSERRKINFSTRQITIVNSLMLIISLEWQHLAAVRYLRPKLLGFQHLQIGFA